MVMESWGLMGNVFVAIAIANISVLFGLLYIYVKSYRQIKIGFTIGLILFASIFLIKSIFDLAFLIVTGNMLNGHHSFMGEVVGGIVQLIAFSILFLVTWDY